jgi:hypothetical protein
MNKYCKNNENWLLVSKHSVMASLLTFGPNRKTILGLRKVNGWTTLT